MCSSRSRKRTSRSNRRSTIAGKQALYQILDIIYLFLKKNLQPKYKPLQFPLNHAKLYLHYHLLQHQTFHGAPNQSPCPKCRKYTAPFCKRLKASLEFCKNYCNGSRDFNSDKTDGINLSQPKNRRIEIGHIKEDFALDIKKRWCITLHISSIDCATNSLTTNNTTLSTR